MKDLDKIALELEARGAVDEATSLRKITRDQVLPANVVTAVRLLEILQERAAKDPSLVNVAARASLLSNQIQGYFRKKERISWHE